VAVWTTIGYVSGNNIDTIYHDATRYSTYFAIAFGVVVLALIVRWVVRRRRSRRGRREPEPGEAEAKPEPAEPPAEPRR
jgi:membrane protein DedA with SNARE-associated domain